jgi:hypothetical protein
VEQTEDRLPRLVELTSIAQALAFRVYLARTVYGRITHFNAPQFQTQTPGDQQGDLNATENCVAMWR